MNWIHRRRKHCCVVNPGGNSSYCEVGLRDRNGRYAKLKLERINGMWRIRSFENCFYYDM